MITRLSLLRLAYAMALALFTLRVMAYAKLASWGYRLGRASTAAHKGALAVMPVIPCPAPVPTALVGTEYAPPSGRVWRRISRDVYVEASP